MSVQIVTSTFETLQTLVSEGQEGMVFLGAGGDPQEWVTGITNALHEASIIASNIPSDAFDAYHLTTSTGGRTDLLFVFKKDAPIEIGKLAIWRLQSGGGCSWLSDFVINYADHYGVAVEEDDEDDEDDEEEVVGYRDHGYWGSFYEEDEYEEDEDEYEEDEDEDEEDEEDHRARYC